VKTFGGAATLLLLLVSGASNLANAQAETSVRPAMILNGGDSVAAHLHYPPRAKAARDQAAIPFYCEVEASGKAAYTRTRRSSG
jgi:hypothetical protein